MANKGLERLEELGDELKERLNKLKPGKDKDEKKEIKQLEDLKKKGQEMVDEANKQLKKLRD